MAKTISKLEEGLLSVNHVLYKILKSSNAPIWWKKVKKDKELYIPKIRNYHPIHD